ncbi:MAG: SagB/ThcOx family dehydrogenase, partial [Vulcanimicrobiota bacterium]
TSLPEPQKTGLVSIEKTLSARKSVRNFSDRTLSLEQLSQLLWAAQGINRPDQNRRTCPSAGATYPLETYVITPKGIYHYSVKEHNLKLVKKGDFREKLSEASLGQKSVARARVNIIFCAVYSRTTRRYGERGIRYVHMEAGHAAQNIHLQAVALGLGSVPVGAFHDNEVKEILECKTEESPIYIIPVGYPQE